VLGLAWATSAGASPEEYNIVSEAIAPLLEPEACVLSAAHESTEHLIAPISLGGNQQPLSLEIMAEPEVLTPQVVQDTDQQENQAVISDQFAAAARLPDILDQAPNVLAQQLAKASPEQKESFYENYLAKYYPRALVIRGKFFAKMSPQALDEALEDFVTLFKKEPGFYFVNDPSRIKLGFYLEAIVGQFSLVSEFLKKAYVDLETQEIFLLEPLLFGIGSSRINCTFLRRMDKKRKKPTKQLLVYLREKRLTSVVRFYAAYFDYLISLFNEAILFRDLKQAQKYQHELDFVKDKLRSSELERSYEDSLKVAKELLNILQALVTRQQEDDDDDDDEYPKKDKNSGQRRANYA
jgi:hypothetical protein